MVVERYFTRYALQEQDILGHKESWNKVLALVPEDILYKQTIKYLLENAAIVKYDMCINHYIINQHINHGSRTLTLPINVRKELLQDFQIEKKPESRWKLITEHAKKKQVATVIVI